jgi:hypothetical protein
VAFRSAQQFFEQDDGQKSHEKHRGYERRIFDLVGFDE